MEKTTFRGSILGGIQQISIIQSIEYITGSYDSDILKAQMAQYYYRNGNPELAEKYANELRLENSLAMDMIENIPKSDS